MSKSDYSSVRFGDVAREVNESTRTPVEDGFDRYVGMEHLDPESLKIRRWGLIEEDNPTFTRVFRDGQVLFGRRRAYQRKAALADFDGICSSDIIVMEAIPDKLLPELLPFIVQTEGFYEYALKTSAGSLSPRTKWSHLAKYEFPLPPLDEQCRIAEILWAVENVIQSFIDAVDQLDQFKKEFVSQVFYKGLGHTQFKMSELGDIPNEWEVKPLVHICRFLDHQRIPIKESERAKRQGPYPYYGASGIVDWIDDYIFDEPLILLSEDGMNLIYRNSPVAMKIDGRTWVNNHAHVLRLIDDNNIDFYTEYLESISYEKYKSGTYQIKINKSVCEKIPVPVPPIHEQQKIAGLILEIKMKREKLMSHIQCAVTLKTGLLERFFSASVEVAHHV